MAPPFEQTFITHTQGLFVQYLSILFQKSSLEKKIIEGYRRFALNLQIVFAYYIANGASMNKLKLNVPKDYFVQYLRFLSGGFKEDFRFEEDFSEFCQILVGRVSLQFQQIMLVFEYGVHMFLVVMVDKDNT